MPVECVMRGKLEVTGRAYPVKKLGDRVAGTRPEVESTQRSRSDCSGCDEAKERDECLANLGVQQAQEGAKDDELEDGVLRMPREMVQEPRDALGMFTRAISRWAERMKESHEGKRERMKRGNRH